MKTINLKFSCSDRFRLRKSDGYSTYSGLLTTINEQNQQVSNHLHDTNHSTFHNTGLIGDFNTPEASGNSHHKYTIPGEDYRLQVSFTTERAQDAYSAMINHFILEEEPLTLTNGELHISEASTESITHQDLLDEAANTDAQRIWFDFKSPVCISDGDLITTMVPHRAAVFKSLEVHWNNTAPEKAQITLDKQTIRNSLIELPDGYNLQSHTVLTSITEINEDDDYNPNDPTINEHNMTKKLLRQGFTGSFGYQFKNASESTQNAIRALAQFCEISGIGRATSRGCGATSTTFS